MKMITIALMAMVAVSILSVGAMAIIQPGPAPNSGDCIPDGSGMDNQLQNGDHQDVEHVGPEDIAQGHIQVAELDRRQTGHHLRQRSGQGQERCSDEAGP